MNSRWGTYLSLIVCIFLTGCGDKANDMPVRTKDTADGRTVREEPVCEDWIHSRVEKLDEGSYTVYDPVNNYPYVDYDNIERYYKVLQHNICKMPENDYGDTALAEYLQEMIESDKEWIAQRGSGCPLTIEYFTFDLNDDSLEDYLVCLHGSMWNEGKGNGVKIYMQEEDGSLRVVLECDRIHLHDLDLPNEHAPVVVLDHKDNGYYMIVLPGQDNVWRYDIDRGRYDRYSFGETEQEDVRSETEGGTAREGSLSDEKNYLDIKHADMDWDIDYEYIERNHTILRHDICMIPKSDFSGTVLEEYLTSELEDIREMCRKVDLPTSSHTVDYFTFDFNDDGLEDYLVCYHGSLWSGTGGNVIEIHVQEDGSSRLVLSLNVRLAGADVPGSHAPIAVLDEKTDGYYAIALPGSNRILWYDGERSWYEFLEDE